MSLYTKLKPKLIPIRENPTCYFEADTSSDRWVTSSECAHSDRIIHGSIIDSDGLPNATGRRDSDCGFEIASARLESTDVHSIVEGVCQDRAPNLDLLDRPPSPILETHPILWKDQRELENLAINFFLYPNEAMFIKRIRALHPSEVRDVTEVVSYHARARAVLILNRVSPIHKLSSEAVELVSRVDTIKSILFTDVLEKGLRHELRQVIARSR